MTEQISGIAKISLAERSRRWSCVRFSTCIVTPAAGSSAVCPHSPIHTLRLRVPQPASHDQALASHEISLTRILAALANVLISFFFAFRDNKGAWPQLLYPFCHNTLT
jgi:hypothetical protein